EPLRFHAVDLVLELRNTTDRAVKVRLLPRPVGGAQERAAGAADSLYGLRLEVKGLAALAGPIEGALLPGEVPEHKEITLAAGAAPAPPLPDPSSPARDGFGLAYYPCPP